MKTKKIILSFVLFSGLFLDKKQAKKLDIDVPDNMIDLIKEIDKIIVQRKGDRIPYTLLVNGINYSIMERNKTVKLKDSDEITVVPIVSGG